MQTIFVLLYTYFVAVAWRLFNLRISFRVTSQALGWSKEYPIASDEAPNDMEIQITWIHHGIGSVFPPDDLWISLHTHTNCIYIYIYTHIRIRLYIYNLLLKVWLMGCATCFICIGWYGERDALWWPAISGHWLPCTGWCHHLLNMKCLMYGLLFLQMSTSLGCFRPRTFFLRNGLD